MQITSCQRKGLTVRYVHICVFAAWLFSGGVAAQVSVIAGDREVSIGSDNDTSDDSGGITGDVEIEGVAIINDKVYIDGVRVPKGKREVTSIKTGRTYRIDWGRNGNITVTEK